MCKTLFELHDMFEHKMFETWKHNDFLCPIFNRYFKWKFGTVPNISKHFANQMLKEAQKEIQWYKKKHPNANDWHIRVCKGDDPWEKFEDYGEDKYLVSFLVKIEEDLKQMLGNN